MSIDQLPQPEAIYLDTDSATVFAVLHPAPSESARDTAVLLCPPFGWDEVCSYRSLRTWAQRLAGEGYTTLRLSFPGTGDSGGSPHDPGLLQAWNGAVQSSVRWLLDTTGARRAAVVGMEAGGLVAYLAAAAGAPIDDLVLWAAPSRGRALVRQLRAFSKLESDRFFEGLKPPPPLPPGELEAGGFVLDAQTVQELEALDLRAVPLASASVPRVLLLARDGLAIDDRLLAELKRGDRQVTTGAGDGYARMTSHPQHARPAIEVFDRVAGWLDQASAVAGGTAGGGAMASGGAAISVEMQVGAGGSVRETQVTVEQPFGRLSGVLTEPLGGSTAEACVVLLNAGSVRRIGPNRMYVEAARRWAGFGIPTLRLDVEGIGEADGAADQSIYAPDSNFYLIDRVPQIRAALDSLQRRGVADRFILGGLCAGAYWSFHVALEDPRVDLALMINPLRVVWDSGLAQARDLRRLLTQRPSWSRIRTAAAQGRIRRLALWMLASPKRIATRRPSEAATAASRTDALLEAFQTSGKRMLLVFAEGQPLEGELRRSGWMSRLEANPAVTVEHIMVRDHTLRPTSAQRQAHAALDRALERELSPPLPGGLYARGQAT